MGGRHSQTLRTCIVRTGRHERWAAGTAKVCVPALYKCGGMSGGQRAQQRPAQQPQGGAVVCIGLACGQAGASIHTPAKSVCVEGGGEGRETHQY